MATRRERENARDWNAICDAVEAVGRLAGYGPDDTAPEKPVVALVTFGANKAGVEILPDGLMSLFTPDDQDDESA